MDHNGIVEIVRSVVESLVDHPDHVWVRLRSKKDLIEIRTHRHDFGQLMGDKAKYVDGIRSLVGVMCAKYDLPYLQVEAIEDFVRSPRDEQAGRQSMSALELFRFMARNMLDYPDELDVLEVGRGRTRFIEATCFRGVESRRLVGRQGQNARMLETLTGAAAGRDRISYKRIIISSS